MFKQIFRIAFVGLIWKQYKSVIISTTVLFAYLWLVGSVHEDYLNYAELQNDKSLAGRSFLLKWAALSSGVLLYIAFHFLFRGSRKQENTTEFRDSNNSKKSNKHLSKKKDSPDPFAAIREKNKLRTRAEIALEKKKPF